MTSSIATALAEIQINKPLLGFTATTIFTAFSLPPDISSEFRRQFQAAAPRIRVSHAEFLDEYYTPDELDELNRFFTSSVGRKLALSTPASQSHLEGVMNEVIGEIIRSLDTE